jgi:hypothetical protein
MQCSFFNFESQSNLLNRLYPPAVGQEFYRLMCLHRKVLIDAKEEDNKLFKSLLLLLLVSMRNDVFSREFSSGLHMKAR